MHDYDPVKGMGLSCPSGGDFYICYNDPDRFIGCCSINPCGDRKGLCPDQHLNPASFNATLQLEFSPQDCINDNVDISWYTCSGTAPPFLGCCTVDICARGVCPRKELRAAKLSDKTKNAEEFLDGDPDYNPGLSPTYVLSTITSGFITSFTLETTLGTITSFAATSISEPTLEPTSTPTAHDSDEHKANLKLFSIFAIPAAFLIFMAIWVMGQYTVYGSPWPCYRNSRENGQTARDMAEPEPEPEPERLRNRPLGLGPPPLEILSPLRVTRPDLPQSVPETKATQGTRRNKLGLKLRITGIPELEATAVIRKKQRHP